MKNKKSKVNMIFLILFGISTNCTKPATVEEKEVPMQEVCCLQPLIEMWNFLSSFFVSETLPSATRINRLDGLPTEVEGQVLAHLGLGGSGPFQATSRNGSTAVNRDFHELLTTIEKYKEYGLTVPILLEMKQYIKKQNLPDTDKTIEDLLLITTQRQILDSLQSLLSCVSDIRTFAHAGNFETTAVEQERIRKFLTALIEYPLFKQSRGRNSQGGRFVSLFTERNGPSLVCYHLNLGAAPNQYCYTLTIQDDDGTPLKGELYCLLEGGRANFQVFFNQNYLKFYSLSPDRANSEPLLLKEVFDFYARYSSFASAALTVSP